MADYVSIISKAIDGLADNSADNRLVIYQKARAAIDRKLRSMEPTPSEEAIARQMAQLEEAINQVEGEHVLASLANAPETQPASPVEPPAPSPPPASPVELSDPVAENAAAAMPDAQPVSVEAVIPPANPPAGFVDDIILIDGIGDKISGALAAEGILGISQIHAISDDHLAAITEKIGFPGFEKTQAWKEQAGEMLGGALPRGKTDQDRLEKLKEEMAPAASQSEAAAPVTAPLTPPVSTPEAPKPVQPDVSVEPATPQPAPNEIATPAADPIMAEPPVADLPVTEPLVTEPQATEPLMRQPAVDEIGSTAPPLDAPSDPSPLDFAGNETARNEPTSGDPFLESPSQIGTPEPQLDAPDAPPYVTELEGDPLAENRQASSVGTSAYDPPAKKKGGKTIGCLLGLAILGGIGFAAWQYQETVKDVANKGVSFLRDLTGGDDAPQNTATQDDSNAEEAENTDAGSGDAKDETRLGSDGSEAEAPATNTETPATTPTEEATGDNNAPRSIIDNPIETTEEPATVEVEGEDQADSEGESQGESENGTSSEESAASSEADDSSTQQVVAINGEKAFLYEEAVGASGASRDEGGMVWSLANEAPEAGAPPEAVIKGVMEIPSRGLLLNLSIKRNVDAGLPASHIIEMLFTAPPDFTGGNIDNISRFVMKPNEQARGESLVGVPARIDTGFFLIALNNLDQAQQTNLDLLGNAEWIDIPVAYVTGRRGLLTFEKGETGRKVFADALADWRNR